ncbi:MAG: hypothetical protein CMG74_10365 [Candidatus Marinimicrobia bacterium]|nr:hypothetical protein [Candidatus Neomarinimicrobiota bacterium]|tara:strand:- start:18160 stop:19125 length:966 start_codon:yes stop_codon:yes gene_type:complete
MDNLLHKINENGFFFSLARYGLLSFIKQLEYNKKIKVLLPKFICRDILAPFNQLECEVYYYSLSENFQPEINSKQLVDIDIVLVVNYFGFPVNDDIINYCKKANVIVIEDNAHGFLSKYDGNWLGFRGDIGLFSFRKTLPLQDGAAYVVNNKKYKKYKNKSVKYNSLGFNPNMKIKRIINKIPFFGIYLNYLIKNMIRYFKNDEIYEDLENTIPHEPNPSKDIIKLDFLAIDNEIKRRRKLYRQCDLIAKKYNITPLFDDLINQICPMGFPFINNQNSITPLKSFALKHGLEIIRWPDFPKSIKNQIPNHYKEIMLVNFLF